MALGAFCAAGEVTTVTPAMLQSSSILQRVILVVNITIDFLLSDARRHNEERREFWLSRGKGGRVGIKAKYARY